MQYIIGGLIGALLMIVAVYIFERFTTARTLGERMDYASRCEERQTEALARIADAVEVWQTRYTRRKTVHAA